MGDFMQQSRNPLAGTDMRRLVLGAAFAVGLASALAPHSVSVRAADMPTLVAQAGDASKASPSPPTVAPKPKSDAATPGKANGDAADSADDDSTDSSDEDVAKKAP